MNDKKINILWISNSAPYSTAGKAGGQTFNYYFKQFASDDRFRICLVCQDDVRNRELIEQENNNIDHYIIYSFNSVKEKIRRVINVESKYNLFNHNVNLLSNSTEHFILKTLKKLKGQSYSPDCIIFEWTNTLLLIDKVKKFFPKSFYIASEHDVTYISFDRKASFYSGVSHLIWQYKHHRLKKKEIKALSRCDIVLPHNRDNANELMNNGIDSDKIMPLIPYYQDLGRCNLTSIGRKKKNILFYGAMSRPENYKSALWLINEVLPLLDDSFHFYCVGGNPPEELRRYSSDRIEITGFVADVKEFFENSFCFVAPLVMGGGIKVKILEAFSSGIPVITNSIGIEGIPASDHHDYILCKTPQSFADAINTIWNNDYSNIGENGRQLLDDNFSYNQFSVTYKDAVARIIHE